MNARRDAQMRNWTRRKPQSLMIGELARAQVMPSSEDFRAKAQHCLNIAAETTDSETATLLRMLAEDYEELAKEAARVGQQQQQIQPKEPGPSALTQPLQPRPGS